MFSRNALEKKKKQRYDYALSNQTIYIKVDFIKSDAYQIVVKCCSSKALVDEVVVDELLLVVDE